MKQHWSTEWIKNRVKSFSGSTYPHRWTWFFLICSISDSGQGISIKRYQSWNDGCQRNQASYINSTEYNVVILVKQCGNQPVSKFRWNNTTDQYVRLNQPIEPRRQAAQNDERSFVSCWLVFVEDGEGKSRKNVS